MVENFLSPVDQLLLSLDYYNNKEYWIYCKFIDGVISTTNVIAYPYGKFFLDFYDFDAIPLICFQRDMGNFISHLYNPITITINKKKKFKNLLEELNQIVASVSNGILFNIHNKINLIINNLNDLNSDDFDLAIRSIYKDIINLCDNNSAVLSWSIFSEEYHGDNNFTRYENIIKRQYNSFWTILQKEIMLHVVSLDINGHQTLCTAYSTEIDLNSVLSAYFIDFLKNDIYLRECQNCKKPFILNGKSIYCDRLIDDKGHTCKDIGAQLKYQKNLSNDTIERLYSKAYKRNYARVKSGKIKPEEFDSWKEVAKHKIKTMGNDESEHDEIIKWLAL